MVSSVTVRTGSGPSDRLKKEECKARGQNNGDGVGPYSHQTHHAPKHYVDEVVATRKKIHCSTC